MPAAIWSDILHAKLLGNPCKITFPDSESSKLCGAPLSTNRTLKKKNNKKHQEKQKPANSSSKRNLFQYSTIQYII